MDNNTVSNLLNTPVNTPQESLNALVTFISLAHHRGAFSIEETAKIHECIQIFKQNDSSQR
jgi:hypothetical protein